MKKPREISLWEGNANCHTENYDDKGGGAYCVEVHADSLYNAKEVRRLIKWLEKAEKWIKNKEDRNR